LFRPTDLSILTFMVRATAASIFLFLAARERAR
jgi:hypothetical protein